MTKKTTGRAKGDGRKPAAAEDGADKPESGPPKFKASDHFEIRVVGSPCAEALFAARLTVLGYSHAEVREAVARLRARKARAASSSSGGGDARKTQQDREGTR